MMSLGAVYPSTTCPPVYTNGCHCTYHRRALLLLAVLVLVPLLVLVPVLGLPWRLVSAKRASAALTRLFSRATAWRAQLKWPLATVVSLPERRDPDSSQDLMEADGDIVMVSWLAVALARRAGVTMGIMCVNVAAGLLRGQRRCGDASLQQKRGGPSSLQL